MLQNADVSANATFIATIQKLGDLTFDKEILGVLAPREYKMPRSQGLRESFEHQAVCSSRSIPRISFRAASSRWPFLQPDSDLWSPVFSTWPQCATSCIQLPERDIGDSFHLSDSDGHLLRTWLVKHDSKVGEMEHGKEAEDQVNQDHPCAALTVLIDGD